MQENFNLSKSRVDELETQVEESEFNFTPVASRDQLSLPLENSLWSKWLNWKQKLQINQSELKLIPFWLNFSGILSIVISVACVLIALLQVLINYQKLSPQVNMYFNPTTQLWAQVDKPFLWIVVVIYAMVSLLINYMVKIVYDFDDRLARVASYVNILANVITVIAIIQIIRLAT